MTRKIDMRRYQTSLLIWKRNLFWRLKAQILFHCHRKTSRWWRGYWIDAFKVVGTVSQTLGTSFASMEFWYKWIDYYFGDGESSCYKSTVPIFIPFADFCRFMPSSYFKQHEKQQYCLCIRQEPNLLGSISPLWFLWLHADNFENGINEGRKKNI